MGASVAGPASPFMGGHPGALPLPATVVIVPSGETLRTRTLAESAMNRFPAVSMATLVGKESAALMAGPLSPSGRHVDGPEHRGPPTPATVVMVPSLETLRTRLAPVSAMYKLPAESAANPL